MQFNGTQDLGFSCGIPIDLNHMVNRNLQDLTYKKSLKEIYSLYWQYKRMKIK